MSEAHYDPYEWEGYDDWDWIDDWEDDEEWDEEEEWDDYYIEPVESYDA